MPDQDTKAQSESPQSVPESENKLSVKKKKKKSKISLKKGVAYINSTYNNTMVSIADQSGNIMAWASSGKAGFKGPKKSTPYAAGIVVRGLADFVKQSGLSEVDVIIKGVGMGRDAAVRGLSGLGIQIQSIKDRTPVPHNGPRARKPRRV
ncbi:30S ribosomal protein S11 [bacterium]|jgi:small subunit ribosomal protein S11|nr:30S ribosomal protein S11 [bacterium]MDP6756171.1 30S ribosomal protein S11 [Patescibacteria group bacterium]|tara:strand:- start:51749 stop:52198 length:450 start_codon:yes stop_codon:yes gene_type:complete